MGLIRKGIVRLVSTTFGSESYTSSVSVGIRTIRELGKRERRLFSSSVSRFPSQLRSPTARSGPSPRPVASPRNPHSQPKSGHSPPINRNSLHPPTSPPSFSPHLTMLRLSRVRPSPFSLSSRSLSTTPSLSVSHSAHSHDTHSHAAALHDHSDHADHHYHGDPNENPNHAGYDSVYKRSEDFSSPRCLNLLFCSRRRH